MAVALTTVAVAPTAPLAFLGLVGIGLAWSFLLAMVVATLQEADPAMMGRVMSLFATVLIGGMAVGGPIVALEVASVGPRAPFLIGAGAAAMALILGKSTSDGHGRGCLPMTTVPSPMPGPITSQPTEA
jgi:MFS family permease